MISVFKVRSKKHKNTRVQASFDESKLQSSPPFALLAHPLQLGSSKYSPFMWLRYINEWISSKNCGCTILLKMPWLEYIVTPANKFL
jgi:hypothetical protein